MDAKTIIQILVIDFAGLGVVFTWALASRYSGRWHLNTERAVLAFEYLDRLMTPTTRRERFLARTLGFATIVPSSATSNRGPALARWHKNVQKNARSSQTELEYEKDYQDIRHLSGASTELGDPMIVVTECLGSARFKISAHWQAFQTGDESLEEFLKKLEDKTDSVGIIKWRKHLRTHANSMRPRFWRIVLPEFIAFLDYVGRGTAFGLFVAILLNGGMFATAGNPLITVVPVLSGLAGGIIHGISVHRRVRLSWGRSGDKYQQWAYDHPFGDYILLLGICSLVLAIPTLVVPLIN